MKMYIVKSKLGKLEGFSILSGSEVERMLKEFNFLIYPAFIYIDRKEYCFDNLSCLMKCFTIEELTNQTDELLLTIFGDEPYGYFLDVGDFNET